MAARWRRPIETECVQLVFRTKMEPRWSQDGHWVNKLVVILFMPPSHRMKLEFIQGDVQVPDVYLSTFRGFPLTLSTRRSVRVGMLAQSVPHSASCRAMSVIRLSDRSRN